LKFIVFPLVQKSKIVELSTVQTTDGTLYRPLFATILKKMLEINKAEVDSERDREKRPSFDATWVLIVQGQAWRKSSRRNEGLSISGGWGENVADKFRLSSELLAFLRGESIISLTTEQEQCA